jgi:Flp pilus assembly protein TadB
MSLSVVAAALAGGAATMLLAAGSGAAANRLAGQPGADPVRAGPPSRVLDGAPGITEPGPAPAVTVIAGLLAGVAAAVVIGGLPGLGVGLVLAPVLHVALQRLEPAAARRRRLAMQRAAPLVADLLAASLAAGVPAERALPVIAHAVGGPTEAALLVVDRRIRLGEPAAVAWLRLQDAPGLGGIARCVARSNRTGAPLAALLTITAQELREEAAAASLAEVRAVAVRSVLPLGLCLLPAFVLLGIVPVVASMLPSL